jgi:hypothetical protein
MIAEPMPGVSSTAPIGGGRQTLYAYVEPRLDCSARWAATGAAGPGGSNQRAGRCRDVVRAYVPPPAPNYVSACAAATAASRPDHLTCPDH